MTVYKCSMANRKLSGNFVVSIGNLRKDMQYLCTFLRNEIGKAMCLFVRFYLQTDENCKDTEICLQPGKELYSEISGFARNGIAFSITYRGGDTEEVWREDCFAA